jgi:hypothetical protein
MSAKHVALTVLAGTVGLGGAGAAAGEIKLTDTAWVSHERECSIRTLKFLTDQYATVEVTWQVSSGQWTLKDGKLHIDFSFKATLDGAVKSDTEIDAIFTWESKDFHSTHKENCALKKTKAP